jgi:hypothetical protein
MRWLLFGLDLPAEIRDRTIEMCKKIRQSRLFICKFIANEETGHDDTHVEFCNGHQRGAFGMVDHAPASGTAMGAVCSGYER